MGLKAIFMGPGKGKWKQKGKIIREAKISIQEVDSTIIYSGRNDKNVLQ